MVESMDRCMEGWLKGWMDRWMEGWRDRLLAYIKAYILMLHFTHKIMATQIQSFFDKRP